MTEKEKMPFPMPGSFTFDIGGSSHKVKIGVTISPMVVLYMDKAIEAGFFANRSDFVTQAMLLFIEKKREEIELDKMLQMEANAFYDFMFREK